MSVTRTAYVNKDTWIAHATTGTTDYGNGITTKITVGPASSSTATYKGRGLFQIPLSTLFDGLASITSATLKIKVAGEECAVRGSTQRIWLERLTGNFSENTASGNCVVATSGDATAKWPGPAADITDRVLVTDSAPATGTVLEFDITNMVTALFDAGATFLRFRLIASDTGSGYAETNTNRTITFYSSKAADSSNRPYLEVVAETTDTTVKAMSIPISVNLSMVVGTGSGTGSALFLVDGSKGVITFKLPNDEHTAILDGVSAQDVLTHTAFQIDKVPSGDRAFLRVLGRVVDADNCYRVTARVDPSGVIGAFLSKLVTGTSTTLASLLDIGISFVAGATYEMKLLTQGVSPTTIKGKVWRTGTAEPDWQVTTTDSESALQADASIGIQAEVHAVTNLPLAFSFDDYVAVAP